MSSSSCSSKDGEGDERLLYVGSRVMKRLNALRNLQLETIDVQTRMYEKVFKLEMECAKELESIHKRRRDILSGTHEPTDAQSNCAIAFPDDATVKEEEKGSAPQKGSTQRSLDDEIKGIPGFWLRVLQNASAFEHMIEPADEKALRHLTDITIKYEPIQEVLVSLKDEKGSKTTKPEKKSGFTITFHFSPNDYFTNKELTKTYSVKLDPDARDPFQYAGPEITGCAGCVIDWKPDHNLTRRIVRKKVRKANSRGQVGTSFVSREVPQHSFFLFFETPLAAAAEVDDEESMAELLENHFDMGHYICEKIIPDAVLLYTGEYNEFDWDDDDEEEDEEEDEDDEDEDEDEDEEEESSEEDDTGPSAAGDNEADHQVEEKPMRHKKRSGNGSKNNRSANIKHHSKDGGRRHSP